MCFFKKKVNKAKQTADNKELVEKNYKMIDQFKTLVTDEKFTADLDKLKDELKYLTATNSEKVVEIDNKIKNKLEDLKIYLVKNGEKIEEGKWKSFMTELNLLIAERKSEL